MPPAKTLLTVEQLILQLSSHDPKAIVLLRFSADQEFPELQEINQAWSMRWGLPCVVLHSYVTEGGESA